MTLSLHTVTLTLYNTMCCVQYVMLRKVDTCLVLTSTLLFCSKGSQLLQGCVSMLCVHIAQSQVTNTAHSVNGRGETKSWIQLIWGFNRGSQPYCFPFARNKRLLGTFLIHQCQRRCSISSMSSRSSWIRGEVSVLETARTGMAL